MDENLRAIEILLVEDNPGDIKLTIRALKDSKLKNNLHIVKNGEGCDVFSQKKENFRILPVQI